MELTQGFKGMVTLPEARSSSRIFTWGVELTQGFENMVTLPGAWGSSRISLDLLPFL